MDAWSLLTAAQRAATEGALAVHRAARRHVVVALSGAHAYGFPSPDSDVDIKCIHVADTRAWLGLSPPPTAAELIEEVQGIEVDYSSNELSQALSGVLLGNGNFIERVLGGCTLADSPWLPGLAGVVRGALSKRAFKHYRGFASSQRRAFDAAPSAKRALYVLRTALTGAHLLRTGEVVPDLGVLYERYGFPEAAGWIERKRAGEKVDLAGDAADAARAVFERAFIALEGARDASALPDNPPDERAVDAWLVELRRGLL